MSVSAEASSGGFTVDWDGAFREHHPHILRYVIHMTGNPELAEDITQDAFTSGMTADARGLFDGKRLLPWLQTIVRNKVYDHGRRQRFRGGSSLYDEDTTDGLSPKANYASRTESFEDRLIDEIAGTQAVEAALAQVPDPYRGVIDARLAGMSYEEIAAEQNLPIGTVQSRIHRGKAHLEEFRAAQQQPWQE